MTVTLQHWGGVMEDVPDDVAEGLLRAGFVQIVGRRPETAMLAPAETAMLPKAAPVIVARKPKKRTGKKGQKVAK